MGLGLWECEGWSRAGSREVVLDCCSLGRDGRVVHFVWGWTGFGRLLTLAPVVVVVDDELWQLSGTALLVSPSCVSVSTKDEGPLFEYTTRVGL